MWYPAAITVAATAEPVSMAQALRQCRLEPDDTLNLEYIQDLIPRARAHVERQCAVRFATQTVTMSCDHFTAHRWWQQTEYMQSAGDMARLPEAPVQSITSISYVDVDGMTQTLSASVYELRADGLEAAIVLKYNQVWPPIQVGSRITVVAVVGYATAPEDVVHAMLVLISFWFENREAVHIGTMATNLDFMGEAMLCNHRRGV